MRSAGDAHSVAYLRRNWKPRVMQPGARDEDQPVSILAFRPVEAAIMLWAAYPKGSNARHYQIDCKHGTSDKTLPTSEPWDNSHDGEILSAMVEEHQANIAHN